MRPGYGRIAEYCAMVSSVTGLTKSAIEWDLPMAQGMQYEAIWLEMQGNVTRPAEADRFDAAQWEKIAGFA